MTLSSESRAMTHVMLLQVRLLCEGVCVIECKWQNWCVSVCLCVCVWLSVHVCVCVGVCGCEYVGM
jgi:hypothetical protein